MGLLHTGNVIIPRVQTPVNTPPPSFMSLYLSPGAPGEEKMAEQVVDSSSGTRFTPMVVLELASDAKEEAIVWLLSRIRDRQQDGGRKQSMKLFHLPSLGMCWSSFASDLCQALIFWWNSWALELEIRRKKTPMCS